MYNDLTEQLKSQLKTLDKKFGKNEKIRHITHDLEKSLSKKHGKKKASRLAFLKVKVKKLLDEKYFDYVKAYNTETNETIKFETTLHGTEEKHVRVLSGTSSPSGVPVVVKWYKSKKRTIQFEIDVYNQMKKLGAQQLNYSSKFKVMQDPVLVMEKLEPLTGNENEFELARQVLTQLQLLHTFTVHNDLKPGNIMKKTLPDGTIQFFLIDFGGCAPSKIGHGYKRSCWTPRFCGQELHAKNQITTAKNDFIELGYTMKGLQNMRNGIHGGFRLGEKGKDPSKDPIRTGFEGKLAVYMERVNKVDEHKITKQDYDDLFAILA